MNIETNARALRIKLLKKLYPPYYDEGINYYPEYRRGFKNPNKTLPKYKVRSYRSWKYNRKTQFKNNSNEKII